MSPIKPRGPAVPPSPKQAQKPVEDVDQTIAEPPRDFTDEIFQQLVGNAPPIAPRPAAGAPPDLPPIELVHTVPMEHAPSREHLSNTKPMYGAPAHPSAMPAPLPPPIIAPPSGPLVHIQAAPLSVAAPQSSEVRVRTPLWALAYLGIALLAIAFGLCVLYTQSRVIGHF